MDLEKTRVDPAKVQDHLSSLITEYGNDEPHLGMNQGGAFVVMNFKEGCLSSIAVFLCLTLRGFYYMAAGL